MLQILCAGSWPLSAPTADAAAAEQSTSRNSGSSSTAVKDCNNLAGVPSALHAPLQSFNDFYTKKYSGRRLQWLFHLSSAEVRLNYGDKPYLVSMSVHQLSVVLLLQEQDVVTVAAIGDETQMPLELLARALRSLADAQLIVIVEPESAWTPATEVRLNTAFTSKRTKFKITMPSSAMPKQMAERVSGRNLFR